MKEDGLWCPRCGEVFHDRDMRERPQEYWTCPLCGTVEHMVCRGPLADDNEIAGLLYKLYSRMAASIDYPMFVQIGKKVINLNHVVDIYFTDSNDINYPLVEIGLDTQDVISLSDEAAAQFRAFWEAYASIGKALIIKLRNEE